MKTKMILLCGLLAAAPALHAHQKFDPAQREAFRQAMDACHAETGVARPQRGVQVDEATKQADHDKMAACMNAKGQGAGTIQ